MLKEGTILVVEDNLTSLEMLTDILLAEGYQVRSVDSGEFALASVKAMPPELILLDILMPGMGGFEVLRRLKAQDETCDIPIIILSGITEVEQRVKGIKLGAVDFISKPFQSDELLVRVRTHMELFQMKVSLERQAAELKLANEQLQIYCTELKQADEALKEANDELEQRVTDRTKELIRVNEHLRTEITEHKKAEQAVRESEERFKILVETIEEVFWMVDIEITRIFYISPGYEHVWGRSRQSLYNNPKLFLDAIHPQDREQVLADLEVERVGQPFDHEYRIIRPDGTIRWIWDRGFPVQTETGQVTRYVGVANDITENKRAEIERRRKSAWPFGGNC